MSLEPVKIVSLRETFFKSLVYFCIVLVKCIPAHAQIQFLQIRSGKKVFAGGGGRAEFDPCEKKNGFGDFAYS